MKAATALISGTQPTADLAEAAVRTALARAGLKRAEQVILFLTRDFSRQAQTAVLAAARAAGCLQISGMSASGLLNEDGWQLDQPAAAALVLSEFEPQPGIGQATLSFTGQSRLPYDWVGSTEHGMPRYGLLDQGASSWQQSRLAANTCAEIRLPGLTAKPLISRGLRELGEWHTITESRAYDVLQLDRQPASDCLRRALPADERLRLPVHQVLALVDADRPGIPVLSANADGSLTLAEALPKGQRLRWVMRQALAAEQEMQQLMQSAVNPKKPPIFGLMLSCIGRGPLFYGGDDLDLRAFRDAFPDTPLLGAYGTGQIVPGPTGSQLFTSAALTLLFEDSHV